MKFEVCELIRDVEGNKFARPDIMLTNKAEKCIVCEVPTRFVDICNEIHICSDECRNKLNTKAKLKLECEEGKYRMEWIGV